MMFRQKPGFWTNSKSQIQSLWFWMDYWRPPTQPNSKRESKQGRRYSIFRGSNEFPDFQNIYIYIYFFLV